MDGLNEKGLHVGLFYFPGFAKYQQIQPADIVNTVAPWELGLFLLSTCSDVRKRSLPPRAYVLASCAERYGLRTARALHRVRPVATVWFWNPPRGNSKIHQNPLGVMSNSPTFDWHMMNLSNYVNLTVSNVPKIDVSGNQIKGLGQGSGMLGIPGDFTPPSRFVRAVAF